MVASWTLFFYPLNTAASADYPAEEESHTLTFSFVTSIFSYLKLTKTFDQEQLNWKVIPPTFPTGLKAASHYPRLLSYPSSTVSLMPIPARLSVSQQEVECALHIEQIVHQACHLNNVAELLVVWQSADKNEHHVKESGCMTVWECIWLLEKQRHSVLVLKRGSGRQSDKQKWLINEVSHGFLMIAFWSA